MSWITSNLLGEANKVSYKKGQEACGSQIIQFYVRCLSLWALWLHVLAFCLYLHRYHPVSSTSDQILHPSSTAVQVLSHTRIGKLLSSAVKSQSGTAGTSGLAQTLYHPSMASPAPVPPHCQGTQIFLTTGMCLKRFYAWVAAVCSHSLSWLEHLSSPSQHFDRDSTDRPLGHRALQHMAGFK